MQDFWKELQRREDLVMDSVVNHIAKLDVLSTKVKGLVAEPNKARNDFGKSWSNEVISMYEEMNKLIADGSIEKLFEKPQKNESQLPVL